MIFFSVQVSFTCTRTVAKLHTVLDQLAVSPSLCKLDLCCSIAMVEALFYPNLQHDFNSTVQ